MGPFVLKEFTVYQDPRKDPPLEQRVKEYTEFLLRHDDIGPAEVPLQNGDYVLTGVQGGVLAMVTRLPEVLAKACQRNLVKFKLGDVVVVTAALREVEPPLVKQGCDNKGYLFFVVDTTGNRKPTTINIRQLVLPEDLTNISRSATIPFTVLADERGTPVLQIGKSDLDMLRERETDIVFE
jgi:hypothetical protein